MRGKRAKQYRKLMRSYGLTFGFREPFQILVDEQIVQDAERYKMDLRSSLERTVQGKVKPMITQCSMRHLYASSASNQALILKTKEFERRRCNHHTLEQPLSSLECLSSVVDPKNSHTNKHRYAVASQDTNIRAHMRNITGVPLIYICRSIMILEPMTTSTIDVKERHEKGKLRTGLKQAARSKKNEVSPGTTTATYAEGENVMNRNKTDTTSANGEEIYFSKKRKRGPKGPNPLSVKKPKERNSMLSGNPDLSTQKLSSNEGITLVTNKSEFTGHDIVKNIDPQTKKRKRKRKANSENVNREQEVNLSDM